MSEQAEPITAPPVQSGEGNAGSGTALAVPVKKPTPKRPRPKQLPPFKVLLHNDDVNEVHHVVLSIMKLTPLSEQQAIERTLEAHFKGLTLLLVTHKERAELYQEQFTSVSLTVTIEPDA